MKTNPIIRSCRDVARIVLESEDRPLRAGERVVLRLHWFICDNCARFRDQTRVMRRAIDRWRTYRES